MNYRPSPEGAPASPNLVLGTGKAQGEATVKDFRQLKVWQRAHQLTLEIYRTTASFPRSEAYALTPQIRRAAVSIPSNLAEGCGRNGDAELARFCNIASGSASELEYQILLARDLKLIKPEDYELLAQQITEIKRMLTVFVQRLTAES
jgi:four helix bundle protein